MAGCRVRLGTRISTMDPLTTILLVGLRMDLAIIHQSMASGRAVRIICLWLKLLPIRKMASVMAQCMLSTGSSNGTFFEYSGYTTGDLIDDNPMNTEEEPALDLEVGSSWSFFSLSFTWDNTVFEASASGTGTAVMEDGDDLIIGGDDFDIIYSGDGQNVVAAGDLTEEQADMLTEDVNVVFEDDTGALMYSGEDDDELA